MEDKGVEAGLGPDQARREAGLCTIAKPSAQLSALHALCQRSKALCAGSRA